MSERTVNKIKKLLEKIQGGWKQFVQLNTSGDSDGAWAVLQTVALCLGELASLVDVQQIQELLHRESVIKNIPLMVKKIDEWTCKMDDYAYAMRDIIEEILARSPETKRDIAQQVRDAAAAEVEKCRNALTASIQHLKQKEDDLKSAEEEVQNAAAEREANQARKKELASEEAQLLARLAQLKKEQELL